MIRSGKSKDPVNRGTVNRGTENRSFTVVGNSEFRPRSAEMRAHLDCSRSKFVLWGAFLQILKITFIKHALSRQVSGSHYFL